MSGVRCFVGLELPQSFVEAEAAARAAACAIDKAWRGEKWVAPQNLHVTLKFIGNVSEGDIADLAAALGQAIGRCDPFELGFDRVRAIPGERRCSMLWAAFDDPSGGCATLAEQVEKASLAFGAQPDERAFKPHATLARARRPRRIQRQALEAATAALSVGETRVSVPSATLFASTLTPRGPVYDVRGTWALGEP